MQDTKTNLLIWNIQIPTVVTLAAAQTPAPPLFVTSLHFLKLIALEQILVNRVHYITNYLAEIEGFFSSFWTEPKEFWLECFGKLVPWL